MAKPTEFFVPRFDLRIESHYLAASGIHCQ
jgi:hypothetical protein